MRGGAHDFALVETSSTADATQQSASVDAVIMDAVQNVVAIDVTGVNRKENPIHGEHDGIKQCAHAIVIRSRQHKGRTMCAAAGCRL